MQVKCLLLGDKLPLCQRISTKWTKLDIRYNCTPGDSQSQLWQKQIFESHLWPLIGCIFNSWSDVSHTYSRRMNSRKQSTVKGTDEMHIQERFYLPKDIISVPEIYTALPNSAVLPDRAGDLNFLCCHSTFTYMYPLHPHPVTGHWKEKRHTNELIPLPPISTATHLTSLLCRFFLPNPWSSAVQ